MTTTRLTALSSALDISAGRFFDPSTMQARGVLDRAGVRLELSLEHTVVALAGATGSGKSSLFNVLTGMDIARVGVRRPTTAEPLACVWDVEGAEPLLDWLEVPALNRVTRESILDSGEEDALGGLVLLDLPDHDSTEAGHRKAVDRLVELVDLFVWVMDPQKYADAAVHERYLRQLSAHEDVTLAVLNQVDRLRPDDVEACTADLRRLLDDDGLAAAPVLPLSAATGEGVDALVDVLRKTVAERRAIRERIDADARRVARRMGRAVGTAEPGEISADAQEDLVETLAEAAGIDTMAEEAGKVHLRPARRVQAPEPPPLDLPSVDSVVDELGDMAVGSLTGGWGGSIRSLAEEARDELPDALREALASVDLSPGRGGMWWRLGGVVEWLALVTGALGGLWALVSEARSRFDVGWLQALDLPEPEVNGALLSMLLFVVGAGVGLVVALVRYLLARRARQRRAEQARQRLRDVVAGVADDVVVSPVRAEVNRYRTFREALADAAS